VTFIQAKYKLRQFVPIDATTTTDAQPDGDGDASALKV